MRRIAGLVDDMLILLILAVTMAHVADFFSTFEVADLKWISVPQAIAMDGAIACSGYLYRVYKGQKQRQWALMGLLFFSASSVVFNYGYYTRQGASLFEGTALASLFPVGVALLAYLRGQRAVSELERSQAYHRSSPSSRALTKRGGDDHGCFSKGSQDVTRSTGTRIGCLEDHCHATGQSIDH